MIMTMGRVGNPGWAFADVLPYFKKAEHYERGGSDYVGECGPAERGRIALRQRILKGIVRLPSERASCAY